MVPDKAQRVHAFHGNTLRALAELVAAAGLDHPAQIAPRHILRRISSTEVRSLAELHEFLAPGELLAGEPRQAVFRQFWAAARPDRFGLQAA